MEALVALPASGINVSLTENCRIFRPRPFSPNFEKLKLLNNLFVWVCVWGGYLYRVPWLRPISLTKLAAHGITE